MHKTDFSTASSEAIIKELGQCLDSIRLSQNISQNDLASEAGVSRSTLTRLARGKPISLDSFVRIMQALKLTDQLAALLPDPSIRPVDLVRFAGKERRRARKKKTVRLEWRWGNKRIK
ncbi:MAG: helix-turn-helix transcriptional regulator [Rhodobacteraceae bacterium]|nr:helix-turn-helix transcriptional regulator [Paracoccaceae bacterium]